MSNIFEVCDLCEDIISNIMCCSCNNNSCKVSLDLCRKCVDMGFDKCQDCYNNDRVVVTIDSINPYSDIQKMATDLGKYWGVGTAEKDNGLIILLCKPCQKIGIATGFGTELVLIDQICKQVIDKTIIPEFKNGDFYSGIKNGVTELITKWK